MKVPISRGHNPAPLLKKCHVHEFSTEFIPKVEEGIIEYEDSLDNNTNEVYTFDFGKEVKC